MTAGERPLTAADVGAAVRSARRRALMTQQRLADVSQVSRQLVNRLEQGDASVTVRPALSVLKTLGLRLAVGGPPDAPDAQP